MQMNNLHFSIILLLPLVLSINPLVGHTPLQPSNNETLNTSIEISDPTKKRIIYAELHEKAEAQHYKLHLNEGARFKVTLYLPIAEKGFMPKLVIMGSGIFSKDVLPKFIKVLNGSEVLDLKATSPYKPKYEPFTQSSYYYLTEIDVEISQHINYHITIFEGSRKS